MSQRQPDDFICPECGHVSRERQDIQEGYCTRCDDWTGKGSSEPVYITERDEC